MGMNIRKARLSDFKTLRSFQKRLVDYERRFDPYMKKGAVEYYDIKRLIRSSRTNLLVVEDGKEVVGCGFGQIRKSLEWSKRSYHGYVGLMFVDEKYRGKGVPKLLLDVLVRWFKEKKVSHVFLEVFSENERAVKAYKKLGFEVFSLEMKLDL